MASNPRGSLISAERSQSAWEERKLRASRAPAVGGSGAPPMTTLVGSPPVWESMTWIFKAFER